MLEIIGLCLLAVAAGKDAPIQGSVQSSAVVPRYHGKLAMRDMDGEGGLDLITIIHNRFDVRRIDAEGRFPTDPDVSLPFPGNHFAWDFADLDGDGRTQIVCLIDGKEVRSFELGEDGKFGAGVLEFEIRSYLPRGVTRMDFVRDVNLDGLEDLVIPGAGKYLIYLQQADRSWGKPLVVAFSASIDYEVGDKSSLTGTFGQRVRIPWFSIEDIDGDGRQDLVSETSEEVLIHLARPDLSAKPTWVIDLEALRAQRPKLDGVDLDDLFSNYDGGIGWRIVDLDGKYPNDLILQSSGTFKTYLGAALAGPDSKPSQVLKVSGNLLYFFVRDVTGDGRPELQLVRGERISLGRVLRWLIFPGSLDFDLFTYNNTNGVFATRPSRRNTVSLEFPRLLSFMDEIDELKEEIHRQESIPARRFAWVEGGVDNDVVDLRDGVLLLYRGKARDRGRAETVYDFNGDVDVLLEQLILHDLDQSGDGSSKTIDLGDLRDWQFSPGAELRDTLGNAPPDGRIPLEWKGELMELVPLDIDGDGRQDFIVVGEEEGEDGRVYVVQFIVRR